MADNRSYILTSGCSHTDSRLDYIDRGDFWVDQLASKLGYGVINLAKAGACARYVEQQICNHLMATNVQPKIVVAQWPNPIRDMEIDEDGNTKFYNVNSQNSRFRQRLMENPESFWDEWKSSILNLNAICKLPLVNICFEDKKFFHGHLSDLLMQGIILHVDEKIPGKTWICDSAAKDKMHHSAVCHSKWADRILTIINENM